MTTERDVYEVDTSGAVEGYEKVAHAADNVEEHQKTLGEQVDEVGKKFANHVLALETYIEIAKEIKSYVEESVTAFVAQEQAVTKLDAALRLAGRGGEEFKDSLEAQARAIERLTGKHEEEVFQVQALLAQYGVAPDMIERMTDAAFRLSNATGSVTTAARLLARANDEGKEELARYNIEVDDAEFKARGFSALLDEVDSKFVSLNDSVPENARRINSLKAAWEDLSKAIGGAVVNTNSYKEKTTEITQSLEFIARLIRGDGIMDAAYGATSDGKFDALVQQKLKELQEAHRKLKAGLEEKPKGLVEMGEPEFPGGYLGEEETAARAKKAIEAAKEVARVEKSLAEKRHEDETKLKEEEEQQLAGENSKKFEGWQVVETEHLRIQELGQRALADNSKKWAEQEIQRNEEIARKELELQKRQAEEVKNIKQQMLADFKQYAQQVLGAIASVVQNAILANTAYNKAAEELQIKREVAASKELGQNKSRADIEKRMADEQKAAIAQEVASVLAGIATQAGVKAILEGAEALAAVARERYDLAGEHAAAAAGFAAVAVAAGGSAYAISSSRGMTSSEREQLEQAQQNKASDAERNAQQTAQRGQVAAGTSITVYNLGISGLTEYEQGQELQRIYDKYGDLKTGSK